MRQPIGSLKLCANEVKKAAFERLFPCQEKVKLQS